jgi:hypothetical protein
MVNCSRTGKVVEAYAPGIYAHRTNIDSVVAIQVGKEHRDKGKEQRIPAFPIG